MNDFMSMVTTLGVGFLIYKYFQMSDEKTKSQKREVELLASFCESGDAKSCTELANLYYNGTSVPQSYEMELYYLEKACEGKDGRGAYWLGQRYQDGLHVKKDIMKAIECFKVAAENGTSVSPEGILGRYYLEGKEVEKDLELVSKQFNEACDKGFLGFCASMFRNEKGEYGKQDVVDVAMFFYNNYPKCRECKYYREYIKSL
jgi:uncharacterized protein